MVAMSNPLRASITAAITDTRALLAQLERSLAIIDGEATIKLGRQGTWSKGQVNALWQECKHLPGIRALFEATASRPAETVTFTEVLAHSGLEGRQQANEHARMSRVAAELFGAKRWPIENWQGGGSGEMLYRMPEQIAVWWRDLTAEPA